MDGSTSIAPASGHHDGREHEGQAGELESVLVEGARWADGRIDAAVDLQGERLDAGGIDEGERHGPRVLALEAEAAQARGRSTRWAWPPATASSRRAHALVEILDPDRQSAGRPRRR